MFSIVQIWKHDANFHSWNRNFVHFKNENLGRLCYLKFDIFYTSHKYIWVQISLIYICNTLSFHIWIYECCFICTKQISFSIVHIWKSRHRWSCMIYGIHSMKIWEKISRWKYWLLYVTFTNICEHIFLHNIWNSPVKRLNIWTFIFLH